jgi:diguanylate cyclase (GGDEF)-like protein/PAS domain S-box-containing protein
MFRSEARQPRASTVVAGLPGLGDALAAERAGLVEAQRLGRVGSFWLDLITGALRRSEVLLELYREVGVEPGDELLCNVAPEERGLLRAELDALAECARPGPFEREVRGDRGGGVYMVRVVAILGEGGLPVSLRGTVRDVTEARRLETRVWASRRRFSDLLAMAPVGIGLCDNAARFWEVNDALCKLLGYRREELRGRRVSSLLHPDELARYARDSAAIWADQTSPHRIPEARYLRGDGASVYCQVQLASSIGDDGERFWLVVFCDITAARATSTALRYRASHDELTGLPSRSAAREGLGELLGSTGAAGQPTVGVLFCDVDNFKRVNDSLGHDAGDALLVAVARRLQDGLPEQAWAARLSGDEFLIVCCDVAAVGGLDALGGVVTGLLREPVVVAGQLVWASVSVGAAVAEGGQSEADLLRFADAAMFEAKRRGSGRVATAGATLAAAAEAGLRTEGQLREAITAGGLTLHYQPVVAVDGAVLAGEALLRWSHPQRGLLTPEEFLPAAEHGDVRERLDRWVLHTALAEAAAWPAVAGRRATVAVNLAALTPGRGGFESTVAEAIAASGIDPCRVVLELVETSMVELCSHGRAVMQALSRQGVRFAVDDFGTGYSSLARLKDLPTQIIKIDQAFTAGVSTDASDRALVWAVVRMARALVRSCVAEGIETPGQFHALCDMGVDGYQGWLFSPALPDDEFTNLLAAGPLPVPPMR